MQALAGDAVVAEVAEDIGEVRQAVVLGTEAQVTLLVEPSCHGRTVSHQHPLPNVKLPAGPHTLLHRCRLWNIPSADAVCCIFEQFQLAGELSDVQLDDTQL